MTMHGKSGRVESLMCKVIILSGGSKCLNSVRLRSFFEPT